MSSKKTVLAVISIVIVCIVVVVLEIMLTTDNRKYDTENIESRVVDWYDNMRVMDFIDSTSLFGYDMTVEEESALLTTYDAEITTDTIIIAVINSEEADLYYDLFEGFLDVRKLNTYDMDLLNYYDKAKLVKGNGYVYFLLGPDTDMYEKELLSFYY